MQPDPNWMDTPSDFIQQVSLTHPTRRPVQPPSAPRTFRREENTTGQMGHTQREVKQGGAIAHRPALVHHGVEERLDLRPVPLQQPHDGVRGVAVQRHVVCKGVRNGAGVFTGGGAQAVVVGAGMLPAVKNRGQHQGAWIQDPEFRIRRTSGKQDSGVGGLVRTGSLPAETRSLATPEVTAIQKAIGDFWLQRAREFAMLGWRSEGARQSWWARECFLQCVNRRVCFGSWGGMTHGTAGSRGRS